MNVLWVNALGLLCVALAHNASGCRRPAGRRMVPHTTHNGSLTRAVVSLVHSHNGSLSRAVVSMVPPPNGALTRIGSLSLWLSLSLLTLSLAVALSLVLAHGRTRTPRKRGLLALGLFCALAL